MSDEITNLFDEIPYDLRTPGTYVEVRPNYEDMGILPYPTRVLLFAQMLDTGAAEELTLYRLTRAEEAVALFGTGSIGHDEAKYFKRANATTDVYAIALKDAPVGIQAAGKFTFSGSGTGVVALYVDGVRIRIKALDGDPPSQLAVAAAAAINGVAHLPVVAAAAAEVVTLTAKHKGECGNDIGLAVALNDDETLPLGIQVAVAPMAGGAGNPDIQAILDVIQEEWFTDYVVPWTDNANLEALEVDLKARFKAMGKKDAHAFAGLKGTFGQLAAKGAVTNSPHLTLIGANGSPTSPWKWAAALAGLAAFHLTNDPARQLRSLVLPGVLPPSTEKRFSEEEQNLLLYGGISTFAVLRDGAVTLSRIITTYQRSNLDVLDAAWLDITTPKTASRIRFDWSNYVSLMYPRCKLVDDDSAAARKSAAVVTPKRMRGSWAARCRLYEDQAWIEGARDTLDKSSFWRSSSDRNRLEAKQIVRIVGNLIVFAASLQFEV